MTALRFIVLGSMLPPALVAAQTCLPRWSSAGSTPGMHMTTMSASPSGPLAGIYGSGGDGRVYAFRGGMWTSTQPPFNSQSVAVYAAAGGDQIWSCSAAARQLLVWTGSTWAPAPVAPPFPYNQSWGKITSFRNPAALYLGTTYNGLLTYLIAWNGSGWSSVVSYINPKGGNGSIDFGYRFGSSVYAGGNVRWGFSTHFCASEFSTLSQVSAITAGTVDGVQRVFVGGPCLNEVLGHIAMAPSGTNNWTTVGEGLATVNCLQVFDAGDGAALYAGTPTGVVRWTGTTWGAFGGGVNNAVTSMIVFDDGSGPGLFVSGSFNTAGGIPVNGFARWGRPACLVNCDASFGPGGCPTTNALDFSCFINRFGTGDPRVNCDGSTGEPLLTANDFLCFLSAYASGCS